MLSPTGRPLELSSREVSGAQQQQDEQQGPTRLRASLIEWEWLGGGAAGGARAASWLNAG